MVEKKELPVPPVSSISQNVPESKQSNSKNLIIVLCVFALIIIGFVYFVVDKQHETGLITTQTIIFLALIPIGVLVIFAFFEYSIKKEALKSKPLHFKVIDVYKFVDDFVKERALKHNEVLKYAGFEGEPESGSDASLPFQFHIWFWQLNNDEDGTGYFDFLRRVRFSSYGEEIVGDDLHYLGRKTRVYSKTGSVVSRLPSTVVVRRSVVPAVQIGKKSEEEEEEE